jgi:hypothetical protein
LKTVAGSLCDAAVSMCRFRPGDEWRVEPAVYLNWPSRSGGRHAGPTYRSVPACYFGGILRDELISRSSCISATAA